MPLKPLHDRVIIKQTATETTTSFGIFIPESKEKPDEGTVMAVGPGRTYDNGNEVGVDMKVGDYVYFQKNAGMTVKLEGETLLVLKESEILAVQDTQ
jgi:chaperonin GroES